MGVSTLPRQTAAQVGSGSPLHRDLTPPEGTRFAVPAGEPSYVN